MYITIYDYASVYDLLDDRTFNRLAFDACRFVDTYTTGVDNVKKLKIAFPVDEDDALAVRRCVCKLVHTMAKIEDAERSAAQANGYTETENGIRGKVITHVSAGNESFSYSSGSSSVTLVEKALADKSVRDKIFRDIIWEYLSGVTDANGVNLLYMGCYPYRL